MRIIILSSIFFPVSKILARVIIVNLFLFSFNCYSFPVKELFFLVPIHINKLLCYVILK